MDEQTFWNSDFEGIQLYFDNYSENEKAKEKEMIGMTYNLASMTASFISSSLTGKQPPSLHRLYPDLFPETNNVNQFKVDMLNFANDWNNKRKNGG